MPGWHDATLDLQEEGKIRMVGIIQEQHPDRCRLFMQWKQMDWPVMVDAQNLLDVAVVPITLLIDENGIIRERAQRRRSPREQVDAFLARSWDPSDDSRPADLSRKPALATLRKTATDPQKGSALDWMRLADAELMWGRGAARFDRAIEAYRQVLELDPEDGAAHFRLGVAYRMRYEWKEGTPADFRSAVEQWGKALETDPNQYIWRRRIQQYGPRLDKPYPFYDWVVEAREAIAARGETPLPLRVEPAGAELTAPLRDFAGVDDVDGEPDAAGRIRRDPGQFVAVHGSTVPFEVPEGQSARVHLELRPRKSADAHWNNEARAMVVWIDLPPGWAADRRRIEFPVPARAVSEEPRRIEFEVQSPIGSAGTVNLSAYALYYVCEGVNGQCLYRRQDIAVPLSVAAGGP